MQVGLHSASAITKGGVAMGWATDREAAGESLRRTRFPPTPLGVSGDHTRPCVGEVGRRTASAARERSTPGALGCQAVRHHAGQCDDRLDRRKRGSWEGSEAHSVYC